MFGWLRDLRRQSISEGAFPPKWDEYIREDVPHDQFLSETEKGHLRGHVQVFLQEKQWEAAGGLELTEEMQVTVAAQACLLLLGLPHHDFYPNVKTIILYPSAYRARQLEQNPDGTVGEPSGVRLGEAWHSGPVILSWRDVLSVGKRRPGENVVLHEFAHKLDMRDGSADGVPPLDGGQAVYDDWADVMSAAYAKLVHDVETGQNHVLNEYGATNHAEFFAVTTECFFENPLLLRAEQPDLYAVFQRYYGQDTAAQVEAAGGGIQ